MRIQASGRNGLSVIEVCLIVAVLVVLASLLLPSLAINKARAPRIGCTTNLKHIGIAARIYANDHEDRFPWMVSTNFNPTNTSGSMELTNSPQVSVHFQAMSNELVTPKVLHCNTDKARSRVQDFTSLGNGNVSYFVGFDARETDPQSILSGDRNITGGITNGFLRSISTNDQLGWTKEIHQNAGNIGMGDGSSQQVTSQRLTRQRALITNVIIRLAIP